MPKLSPISWKNLIKKLKAFGFEGPYSGGKHLFMIKGNIRLTVPNPHRKEIFTPLLSRILKEVDIPIENGINSDTLSPLCYEKIGVCVTEEFLKQMETSKPVDGRIKGRFVPSLLSVFHES